MVWSKNIPDIVRPPEPWCFNALQRHRRLNIKKFRYNGRDIRLQERALHNLIVKVAPQYRHRIGREMIVVSSYRSCKLQCEIIHAHDPNASCEKGIPGIAAPAGHSGHQLAVCVDMQPPPPDKIPEYRHVMEANGWINFSGPNGSDPNHWGYHFDH